MRKKSSRTLGPDLRSLRTRLLRVLDRLLTHEGRCADRDAERRVRWLESRRITLSRLSSKQPGFRRALVSLEQICMGMGSLTDAPDDSAESRMGYSLSTIIWKILERLPPKRRPGKR